MMGIIRKTVLPLLLCISIIIPLIPAASADTRTADGAAFGVQKTVYPSDLLRALVNDVSMLEAKFVDGEWDETLTSTFTVQYDETTLIDLIEADVTESDGGLTVTVRASSRDDGYILWTPVSARITAGESVTEVTLDTDGKGAAQLLDTTESAIRISVDYQGKTSHSQKQLQLLLNAAYNAGNAGIAAFEKYEDDLATYDEQLAAYEKYCAELEKYEQDLKKYNDYLNSSKEYNSALADYNEYLTALEEYKGKLGVYETYLAEYQKYEQEYADYLDFLQNPEKYEKAYNDYVAYCERKEEIKAQIDCVQHIFVTDSGGNNFYVTLIEDNVAAVLKNQDALVATGCDPQDIADADRATRNLIEILGTYPRRSPDYAKRYEVYAEIYTPLRDNVTLLFTKLAKLYENDVVPSILDSKGKLERYWQFVSQLYILHCALDDSVTFNPNWNIAGAYPADLIEDCQFAKDTNSATPKGDYPSEVSEAPNPATIKKPIPPTEVRKPMPPAEVKKPTPPTEVSKPNYPTAVPHPGNKPTAPVFSEAVNGFMAKIESGELTARTVDDNAAATFAVTAERAVGLGEYVAIGIYEQGSSTLASVLTAKRGSEITLPTPVKTEFSDREYNYTFRGWSTAEDSLEETFTPDTDSCLFANYDRFTRVYSVTWVIDGTKITTKHPYGTPAQFSGIMPNPDSAEFEYKFSGWSPMPVRVTEDVQYAAEYQLVRKKYTVTWKMGNTAIAEEYSYGDTPVFSGQSVIQDEIERLEKAGGGKFIYRFDGWDKQISTVSGNVIYTAVFAKTPLIPDLSDNLDYVLEPSGSSLKLIIKTTTGEINASIDISGLLERYNGKSLTVELEGARVYFSRTAIEKIISGKGEILKIKHSKGVLCIDITDIDQNRIDVSPVVTLDDDGSSGVPLLFCDGQSVEFETSEQGITFALTLGKTYELKRGFSVDVIDAEGGECVISVNRHAIAGDSVVIELISRRGYGEGTVIIQTTDGETVEVRQIDGMLCFTMPAANVTVTPNFERIRYTISFVSDGKTISESEYFYGDTVTPPASPTKDEDGEYTYTFVGWDKPIRTVDRDETYTAVFMSVPISVENSVPVQTLGLLDMALIASASAVVTAGAVLAAFFVLRHRKRKKSHLD